MTITPDNARELLDGATPGPWKKRRDRDGNPTTVVVSAGPTDRHHIMTAEPSASWDRQQGDTAMIAAAPDMAETIAGMSELWAVEEVADDGGWWRITVWHANRADAEHFRRGAGRRLVRRLVGPVETVEGA